MEDTISAPHTKTIGRLHWHPLVHQEWTRRQMYFWFFSFETLYSPREVLEALREVAADFDITSFATYELLGAFDVLARLYLDPSSEKRFAEETDARLGPLGLTKQQAFRVDEVSRHWVWASAPGATGPIERPDRQVLRQRFPRTELLMLNEGKESREYRELVDRYERLRLVTEAQRALGIKFVVTIGSRGDSPSSNLRGKVLRRLQRALDEADEIVMERSIYAGVQSQRELFLVMCRIDHRNFHKIRKAFLEPIGEAAALFGARTTTYSVLSDDFICYEDWLAVDEPETSDVASLLRGPETQRFEVKGSVFAPLNPWLREGEPLRESKAYPLGGVLKSIVGMLNSGGGTIVVGALEDSKYQDAASMPRLDGYPLVGEFRILGLCDPTFRDQGWDEWDKKLRNLIRGKIDRNPGVLVRVRPDEIEGRQVCVIDVDEAGEEDKFFLRTAQDTHTFYARHGTEVVPLNGTAIEDHCNQDRQRRLARRRSANRRS